MKDLPLYVAELSEATVTGEPELIFRAKRDYEESASSSSKPTAVTPVKAKAMPKSASAAPLGGCCYGRRHSHARG